MSNTIILIDDDPDDLEIYRLLLGFIDPNIVTRGFLNPMEALKYLETLRQLPHLVILDFNMPQMNGLQFLKLVRGNLALAGLQVTVVTTACNPRDVEELLLLGADCHVKPSALSDFQALIERLIGQATPLF
jgi:DNA-binding response OmpR family regulator